MSDDKKYTFTQMDILEEVKSLAKSKPDYVYPPPVPLQTCSYVRDADGAGEGHGCIVGQALMRHGVSVEDLSKVEESDAKSAIMTLLDLKTPDSILDNESLRIWNFLNMIQMLQDESLPWGEALDKTISMFPEFA